jgi:hypothetical protein
MATLNGLTVTSATLTIPRWGIPTAHVRVDGAEELTGQVTLELAGLSFVGTVVPGRGGSFNDAGSYFIVGGFGGWSRVIPKGSYKGPLTRLQTVVTDAARACGETAVVDAAADRAVGPYVRFQGLASSVLEQFVPEGWWVDLDGTTRVGARPSAPAPIDPLDVAPARGVVHLAVEDVSELLPGATVTVVGKAREISTVVHLLEEGSLRTDLYLLAGGGDRMAAAIRGIIAAFTAPLRYHGVFEVRVVSQEGDTWNVEPVDTTLGLPQFPPVPARTSIPGLVLEVGAGAHLLVGFINGNPARPYVCGFPGTADPGALPALVKFDADAIEVGGAGGYVLRSGDLMSIFDVEGNDLPGPLAPLSSAALTLALHSTMTTAGDPGVGHSKAKA